MTEPAERPIRHKLLYPVGPLLGLGIGSSVYLSIVKLRLQYDPDYTSSCNFGEKLNCDKVATSEYSAFMDLPVALWAIPAYLAMAYLVSLALAGRGEGRRWSGRAAVRLLLAAGAASSLYSLYLAYVSTFVLQTYCLFCIAMYVTNFGTTALAWLALQPGASLGDVVRRIGAGLVEMDKPLPQAALVFLCAFGASWMWYDRTEQAYDHYAKARIDQMLNPTLAATARPSAVPAPTANASAKAPAPAPAAAPTPARRTTASKPKAVRTENGLSYFEAPVTAEDHVWGKRDAPVTIVKYADFECGYCRILALNMKKVKEKFGDRIRVVMKHYPMNADCNPRMGGDRMHEFACVAARASECAGSQGQFWEMHDVLYENQQKLDEASVKGYASQLGLDAAVFAQCLKDPAIDAKIRKHIMTAGRAGIWGTPRLYINGRLLSGAASPSIIGYLIEQTAKEDAGGGGAEMASPVAATAATAAQVKTTLGGRDFWIDAFEASVDDQGRAVSIAGAIPARLSWHDAEQACQKSGKRLCTEQEWVTACAGQDAVDNNNNRLFADDDVEGWMYPYGAFYEKGRCWDAEDSNEGEPGKTGVHPGCRTPTGIYDLVGNLGEWVGGEASTGVLLGGDFRGGERAACNRRSSTFGAGIRNKTTGFRCCSDKPVANPAGVSADKVDTSSTQDIVGKAVPPSFQLETEDGTKVGPAWFKGKTTYVTFFASWCGSCKRELPALRDLQTEFGSKGFKVLAIGTDRLPDRSKDFVNKYDPNYPVAYDPESVAMGIFNIDAMPASFLVDTSGVVRTRTVGFRPEDLPQIRSKIQGMLGK